MAEHITKTDDGQWMWSPQGYRILGDVNKAQSMAGFIQVAEEALKFARKELKTHVQRAGGMGIAIPGKIFEFRQDESINWDKVNKTELKHTVSEIFERHGVDPKIFMGFSQTFTSGVWLVTENKELLDDLAAALPRKVSTEFGGYKV